MKVGTNLNSIVALRNVQQTNASMSVSLQRLSTGLRINSAADDAAGLIASENYRAQLGGLRQARMNIQNSMNLAKTAEGGLGEINTILNRIRTLAVSSANDATLTEAQRQANQNEVADALSSINRIAETTQFGSKKLLDGSSGINAAVVDSTNVASMSFTGEFGGYAITGNSSVVFTVTTAAQKAAVAGTATFAAATTAVGAGSFTINGRTFTTSATDTVAQTVQKINEASGSTGVQASFTAGGGINLASVAYGLNARVDLTDADAVLLTAAGTASDTGLDAAATVQVDVDGSGSMAAITASFASGSGLTLKDTFGNTIVLSEAGNATTTAVTGGQLSAGSTKHQIGAFSGQSATLSIGNYVSSSLGKGVVSGLDLSGISMLSASGASNALQVVDKAINDISKARADIGSFMRNTLDTTDRSLAVAVENMSATDSAIRDTDMAEEMTVLTKNQILMQAGMAMLGQANSLPQGILSLLR